MATETAVITQPRREVEKEALDVPQRIYTLRKAPRHVVATLNYYRDPGDGSKPMPVYVGGNTVTNERPIAPTRVLIHDVTGSEDKYALDTHGFQLVRHESAETTFDDETRLKEKYYPECEQLYKKITGASHVQIFNHLHRRGPTNWHSLGPGNASQKGPLHRVHIDQSRTGASLILLRHFPALASTLLSPSNTLRWSIINLWRPVHTIYKDPLAIAAAYSIPDDDLLEADVVYEGKAPPFDRSVTWTVKPGKGSTHEWYYKNEMNRGEVWLVKCFDNEEGVAGRSPHCAFIDEERMGGEWGDRESVEVRAVLVWE